MSKLPEWLKETLFLSAVKNDDIAFIDQYFDVSDYSGLILDVVDSGSIDMIKFMLVSSGSNSSTVNQYLETINVICKF